VQRRMAELKSSYQAVLAMTLLGVVGLAPRALQKQTLDFLARKATAVMTNVPGPQQPLYFAGAKIRRMMFWVPQSGDIGVGVSILSYAGGVQFGMITDKRMCAEPQRIIDRFAPEFEKIVLALCMLPWDRPVDPDAAQDWLFPGVPGPAAEKRAAPKRTRRKARKSAVKAKPVASAAAAPGAPVADGPTASNAAGSAEATAPVEPDASGAVAGPADAVMAPASPQAKPRRPRTRRSAFAIARSAE
jgi:diacylglycerol O-acyltransferase / wax synthase